jgi:hypothetical protein
MMDSTIEYPQWSWYLSFLLSPERSRNIETEQSFNDHCHHQITLVESSAWVAQAPRPSHSSIIGQVWQEEPVFHSILTSDRPMLYVWPRSRLFIHGKNFATTRGAQIPELAYSRKLGRPCPKHGLTDATHGVAHSPRFLDHLVLQLPRIHCVTCSLHSTSHCTCAMSWFRI